MKSKTEFDMGKLVFEGMMTVFIVLIILFIAQNWAVSDGTRNDTLACETNTLEEAFAFCGVSWAELNEKWETTNYIHLRNTAKKRIIIMHKYSCHNIREEDIYFFAGSPGKCWFIKCRFNGRLREQRQTWVIYAVSLEDDAAPFSILFRATLNEYFRETGRHKCPHTDKKKGKKTRV